MLTRKAAVAEIVKLQEMLKAAGHESRKSLRERVARTAKENHELRKQLELLESRVVELNKTIEKQRQLLEAVQEFLTEEQQIEFELRREAILGVA